MAVDRDISRTDRESVIAELDALVGSSLDGSGHRLRQLVTLIAAEADALRMDLRQAGPPVGDGERRWCTQRIVAARQCDHFVASWRGQEDIAGQLDPDRFHRDLMAVRAALDQLRR